MNLSIRYRHIQVSLMLLMSMALFLPTALHAEEDAPHKIFLPVVTSTSDPVCELNEQEEALAELFRNHPDQQRTTFNCDPVLSQVARARAEDMAQRSYFNHTNPDGHGPNFLVLEAGYVLPAEYSRDAVANNIESIGAGPTNASGMWDAWMASSGHRSHLLGDHDFYAAQTDFGIGYAYVPGSTYQRYWVILSSKPN